MKQQGLLRGLKLKHRSGYLDCATDADAHSRTLWGCWTSTDFILTVITDSHQNIVFPDPKIVTNNSYYRYTMRGYGSKTSKYLTFVDLKNPMYVEKGTKLRIWYGADLNDHTESDNSGKHCVDVYAKIIDDLSN